MGDPTTQQNILAIWAISKLMSTELGKSGDILNVGKKKIADEQCQNGGGKNERVGCHWKEYYCDSR